MGAYVVLETDENTGGVVFATDEHQARKAAACEFDIDEECEARITRREDLDQYETSGVPASLLIEQGWFFECHGCSMHLDDDNLYEKGLTPAGVIGAQNRAVYCCQACRLTTLSEDAARKTLEKTFLDMMADLLRRRFPGADLEIETHREQAHAYVQRHCDPLVIQEARLCFGFPGMKHGTASIEYRHPNAHGRDIIGPAPMRFYCCTGDLEAFEAFADRYPLATK